jgi:hypothetical protein
MRNIHMLKNKKKLGVPIFPKDPRVTRDTHLEYFPENYKRQKAYFQRPPEVSPTFFLGTTF